MAYPYSGQLRSNEIFAALFNMIISQQVFSDNIASTQSELVNMAKVDGTLYGDTKLYYSTDILGSTAWGNDAEAQNLLALHRPEAPEIQSVTISNFRQIALTVDDYLSKRAWGDANAFGQFMAVMQGWVGLTKDIYEAKLFNTYVGTQQSSIGEQSVSIVLPANENPEVENRIQAQTIANELANLYVRLADANRYFNDFGNYRSFAKEDMVVVWNSDFVNKITKFDLPTIFHKDGLFDGFKHVLPAHYFGTINAGSGTTTAANATVRSLIEKDYNTVARNHPDYDASKHIFPGDLLPSSTAYGANETYTEDSTVVFKMYHKNSIPFMSAFEVGTSFFNPKSLTENRYLTWGYSDLEYLKNYPFITAKAIEAEA